MNKAAHITSITSNIIPSYLFVSIDSIQHLPAHITYPVDINLRRSADNVELERNVDITVNQHHTACTNNNHDHYVQYTTTSPDNKKILRPNAIISILRQHTTFNDIPLTLDLTFDTTSNVQQSALQILHTVRNYYSIDSTLPTSNVLKIIHEATIFADKNYGIEAAVQWGNGYTFPPSMLRESVILFKLSGYNLPSMVTTRLRHLSHCRLSPDRVNSLSTNNPERRLLFDLSKGMRVSIPDSFKPNGNSVLTPLRSTYVTVHTAVNKLMGDLIIKGLAFLLPKSLAIRHIPNLHFAKAHWAPKSGKPSGRAIGDLTFMDGTPLNTDSAKAHTENFYGLIHHPQINDMVRMIITFYDISRAKNLHVKWSDLRL